MVLYRHLATAQRLLPIEQIWRQHPAGQPCEGRAESLLVARWLGAGPSHLVCDAEASDGCRLLEVNLRPTDVALTIGGTLVHDGKLAAGSVLLTGAKSVASDHYRSSCDLLHLFIPVPRLEAQFGHADPAGQGWPPGYATPDPVVVRLALSLLHSDDPDGAEARHYAEGVAQAIVGA